MKRVSTLGRAQRLVALERLKSTIRRILEPTKWDTFDDYSHQITRMNILGVSSFILLVHVVVSPSDWLIFGKTGFVETITRWRQILTGLVLLTCATMLLFPRARWTKWVYWATACTAIVVSYALMGRFALTYNAGFAFKLFGPMLPLLTIEPLIRRVQFTGLTILIIIGSTLVFTRELAFSFNGFIYVVYLFLSGSVSVGAGFITTMILRENYEQAWKLRRLNEGLEDLVQERARQATLALERLHNERAAVSKELARELHDEMGAQLALLNFQLANSLHTRETLQEEAADKHLRSAQQTVASLEAGIRSIINQYRQTQGGEGLVKDVVLGPIDSFAEHWSGMVDVSIIPAKLALTPGQLLSVSRFIQECLTNVSKHANATAVDINVFLDEDEVQVMVWDNGAGINARECNSAHGFGLEGMRERAKALGGQIELFSSPGDGLRVTLRFPKEHPQP